MDNTEPAAPLDLTQVPSDLPVPVDDGATNHLRGQRLPDLALPATAGGPLALAAPRGPVVLFCYPMTGRPGVPLPEGWDAIPGARGCTPQACRYRDAHLALLSHGARVFGVSTQNTEEQAEAAVRLGLPYALLSDAAGAFARALVLPTFTAGGQLRIKRLTLCTVDAVIERVVYPIFPSDADVTAVLAWLASRA